MCYDSHYLQLFVVLFQKTKKKQNQSKHLITQFQRTHLILGVIFSLRMDNSRSLVQMDTIPKNMNREQRNLIDWLIQTNKNLIKPIDHNMTIWAEEEQKKPLKKSTLFNLDNWWHWIMACNVNCDSYLRRLVSVKNFQCYPCWRCWQEWFNSCRKFDKKNDLKIE